MSGRMAVSRSPVGAYRWDSAGFRDRGVTSPAEPCAESVRRCGRSRIAARDILRPAGRRRFTWTAVIVLTFLVPYGLVMAELGSSFPQEGGPYVWVRLAFGRFWASLSTMYYWITNPVWLGGSLAATGRAARHRADRRDRRATLLSGGTPVSGRGRDDNPVEPGGFSQSLVVSNETVEVVAQIERSS